MLTALRPAPGDVAAYKESLLRDPCAYCDAPAAVLDHVTPRALGGGGRWSNMAGACAFCNGSKGARTLLAFLGFRVHRERWEAVDRERALWGGVGV